VLSLALCGYKKQERFRKFGSFLLAQISSIGLRKSEGMQKTFERGGQCRSAGLSCGSMELTVKQDKQYEFKFLSMQQ